MKATINLSSQGEKLDVEINVTDGATAPPTPIITGRLTVHSVSALVAAGKELTALLPKGDADKPGH